MCSTDLASSPLGWALLCFALFAVVAVLVTHDWGPLTSIDNRGDPLESWAVDTRRGCGRRCRSSRWRSRPSGMTVLTAVLAGAMLLRKHRRAAVFAVVVMVATSLLTTLLKVTIGRGRPPWQDTDGLLKTQSFPSGHASSITAFAGIVIVLVDHAGPPLEHPARGVRRSARSWSSWSAPTGCCSGGTTPAT